MSDYSSDDSIQDPNFSPNSDYEKDLSSESDSDVEIVRRPIQAGQTANKVGFPQLVLPGFTAPSTSGSTSSNAESQWLKQKLGNIEWEMPSHEDPPPIEYTAEPFTGMKDIYTGILAQANPIDFFDLFLTNDIIVLMVEQTNLFATQYLLTEDTSSQSRSHLWTPVTANEMIKFLALIGWMGLVKLPAIRDYWRVHKLYGIPLARTVMPRNRFELILKFLHFSDNLTADTNDRLYKIKEVLEKFIKNYQKTYTPGEKICVDESLIPWRGRLIFRQYIPNKAAKYGIKVYKLCTEKGYTWNLQVYCGKSKDPETEVPEKTVMSLTDGLLDKGRTVYTDNYYTSIPLAYRLRRRKTHLVGTLRANRKYLPKNVIGAKLKRGEMSAMQTKDGIVVLKWRDKRDVRMLSTKTSALKVTTSKNQKNNPIIKPECITEYNTGKSSIDLSDQMATYGSALRRCTKWYRKLAIEIIWGTSLVNAHFLYNEITTNKKMTITEFREQVITGMLDRAVESNADVPSRSRNVQVKHYLIKNEVDGKKVRGRCSNCYQKYGRKGKEIDGKIVRASQVNTKCSVCHNIICQRCFNSTH